ncbi:hypothetical protein SDC9_53160 [bioreactor metagenome]|uniref:DUF2812 domain-containing protein n=1 Tax=bioreactor metagenome TaxID=1076179 RepID=A0A644WT56_9ZZZZ
MKKCFKLHPTQYAARQTEKFYADMAKKGWVLEKRGEYLSRFRRVEPQNTLFKVELTCQNPADEGTAPPKELKDIYEGAGWTFVARRGLVNLFSAPAGTCEPDIPEDAAAQSCARRTILKNIIATAVVFAAAACGLYFLVRRGLLLEIVLAWYTDTAKILLVGSALALLLFDALCSALHAVSLLGKGSAAGREPSGNGGFRRAVIRALLTACLGFAMLTAYQLGTTKEYDMPTKADGPYILLSELGWTGKRTYSYEKDDVSVVTHVRALLSEQWYTREFVEEQPDGAKCMLEQRIFRLQSPGDAMTTLPSVMSESVFARGEDEYTKVEVPGLDAAWQNAFEYIAVKDSTVYYLIYLDSSTGTPAGSKADLLQILAQK